MEILHKPSAVRRCPPGMEWNVLKKVPMGLLGGLMIPLFFNLSARLFTQGLPPGMLEHHLAMVNVLTIALMIILWMSLLTLSIACLLVTIVKGSAFVTDPNPPTGLDKPPPRGSSSRLG